jgi:hypothetical protein
MEQNLAKWAMIGKFELDRHFVKNDLYSGLTGKSKAPIRQAILKELTGKELPASKVSINLVFDSLMNWYDKNFAENGLSGVDWQNISFTIEESKHTKTGEAIWLIKFDKIKNYDDFKALEKRVKPIAYYSKFVKAFVAKNEVTEADVRAVLGSGGASAPSPTRTQTPKKLINFESGKTRRDIVRKEVEAGKMLSARYKYFNGMIDMYEYVPFKDMVWEDANNKYVLDYLKNYRVTIDSKDRTVSLEDYYWLVYKDDFEAMKAYHEEAVRKNKAEQVLQELLRSRVLSVDKYKQLVETQPYYLLNWRDLYDLHKALLEYAYQDDQYNFYGLISDKGVLANLVAFMYEGDLWEAIKEDMKRAEQDLPTNQRNFAEALQDANKYGKKIWHIKTNTIDLEELTEKLSSLNFTTPLSGTTTLFPKFKGELDIIE